MKLFKHTILLFSLLCFLSFAFSVGTANAYYGSGLYGMYGGLYGGYGGMYGMYGGLYGGLCGLYGGMYGGLGGGIYGGLYGGLYGIYGGMFGMMRGLYNPFSLQNMYYSIDTGSGLGYQVPFLQIAPLIGMAGLYNSLFPNLFNNAVSSPAAVVAAEQAGYWEGLWNNGIYTGPMTLNLIEDPLTLTLSGNAQLIANVTLGVTVPVTGTALNGQVVVAGTGIGIGSQIFELEVVGILTSTTTMEGTFTLLNTGSGAVQDSGTINLVLSNPVI